MRVSHNYITLTFLGLAAILTLGCRDSTGPLGPTTEPATGAIEVSVSTTVSSDSDVDPDGYTLSIVGASDHGVGVNGSLSIGALPIGVYLVRLHGLAPNCSVRGTNPLAVRVTADTAATRVSFSVSCSKAGDGAGDWDY